MLAIQDTLQPFNVDDTRSGCECFFIRYKDFGIKLYGCEAEANRVASRQRTASEHGLGPEVLSEVIAYDIPNNLNHIIERARPNFVGLVLYGYETEIVDSNKTFATEQVAELRDAFYEKMDQIIYDSGCGNVGFKNNGELVCIDFGDCSFDNNF